MYRHPSMELLELNSDYLRNLLGILSSENKTVVPLEDFYADLLQHDRNSNISDSLDLLYSSLLLAHIFSRPHTTARSASLIDNVYTSKNNFSLFLEMLSRHCLIIILSFSQPAIACSIETLEQGVKYVQS